MTVTVEHPRQWKKSRGPQKFRCMELHGTWNWLAEFHAFQKSGRAVAERVPRAPSFRVLRSTEPKGHPVGPASADAPAPAAWAGGGVSGLTGREGSRRCQQKTPAVRGDARRGKSHRRMWPPMRTSFLREPRRLGSVGILPLQLPAIWRAPFAPELIPVCVARWALCARCAWV